MPELPEVETTRRGIEPLLLEDGHVAAGHGGHVRDRIGDRGAAAHGGRRHGQRLGVARALGRRRGSEDDGEETDRLTDAEDVEAAAVVVTGTVDVVVGIVLVDAVAGADDSVGAT